ncbi:death domain-associated protein 6 isoform X3 [Alligator mississippiensis]|uniref:death domain-associated protein 6 isoform X3 n=1 Tax=Alligator mississippiensis TaxID=8496 RepID=UPI002877B6B0|nr:death domain-associated protein 6 isoform X3 [Alligator mississippiensis]
MRRTFGPPTQLPGGAGAHMRAESLSIRCHFSSPRRSGAWTALLMACLVEAAIFCGSGADAEHVPPALREWSIPAEVPPAHLGCAAPPRCEPAPMAAAPHGSIIVLDDDDYEGHEAPPTPPTTSPLPTSCAPQDGPLAHAVSPPPPSQASLDGPTIVATAPQDRGAFQAENEQLFADFLACCSQLTEEHPEVVPYLTGRHQKASPAFLGSAEFRNVLSRCLTRVQARHHKVYVYINEVCTVLKANTQRRKLAISAVPAPCPPLATNQEQNNIEEHETADTEAGRSELAAMEAEVGAGRHGTGSKRQIRYLENLLHIYMGEIRRLQERELDLTEMDSEDSTYLQESRLKRRMMRIFERLCELKQCSSLTGRVIEQRIPYRGTRYPEVNRRIERFINRPDIFPDYSDILKVIQKASARHGLALKKRQIESMAQDAFRDVGNRLQERRHLDLIYNFGSHLTDHYRPGTDPALTDPMLARRLRENQTTALNRLESVISHYAQLQDESEEEERIRRRAGQASRSPVAGSSMASRAEEVEEEEEEEEDSEREEALSTDAEGEPQQSLAGEAAEGVADALAKEEAAVGEATEDDQCMKLSEELLPSLSGMEDSTFQEIEHEGEEEKLVAPTTSKGRLQPCKDPEPEPGGTEEAEAEGSSPSPAHEMFVLEIEALPLESSETPPPSPQGTGGSEATPKAVPSSPAPSEATAMSPPSPEAVSSRTDLGICPMEPTTVAKELEGADHELRTQLPAKRQRPPTPEWPRAPWPLENGARSPISSTSSNGSTGPPAHKRGRHKLALNRSSCIEVHSVGSEEEDEGSGLCPTRQSPLPDSTRCDSPFQSLVSSSQSSPQPWGYRQLLAKACKTSVATQCDPEEIIVLSDSD